jgi:hypothetical protein
VSDFDHAQRPRPARIITIGPWRCAIAALLGALTCVGLAWWFAAQVLGMSVWADPGQGRVGSPSGAPIWSVRTWASFGYTTQNCSVLWTERQAGAEPEYPGTIRYWSMAASPPTQDTIPDDGSRDYVWFSETAAGWPFKALRSWTRLDGRADRPHNPNYAVLVRGTLEFTLAGEPRRVPTLPIWPGLVANTLLFSTGWWLLLSAPVWLRRGRRKARGRCIACGYDRAGLAPAANCPECGSIAPPPGARLSGPSASA